MAFDDNISRDAVGWYRISTVLSMKEISCTVDYLAYENYFASDFDGETKWEHKSSQRPHTSAEENMDPDFELLRKLNGDFVVQGYVCDMIFMKSDHSLRRHKPNCGKCPISQCWRILLNILDSDPEADVFQNLTISTFCTDTSVAEFSRRSFQ